MIFKMFFLSCDFVCPYVQFGSLSPSPLPLLHHPTHLPGFFLDFLPLFYGHTQQNINRLWVHKCILEQEDGVKCGF